MFPEGLTDCSHSLFYLQKCEKARANYEAAINKVNQHNAKGKLNLVKVIEVYSILAGRKSSHVYLAFLVLYCFLFYKHFTDTKAEKERDQLEVIYQQQSQETMK